MTKTYTVAQQAADAHAASGSFDSALEVLFDETAQDMELVLDGNFTSAEVIRFAGDARNGATPATFTGDDLSLLSANDTVFIEVFENETTQIIKVSSAR